MSVNSTSNICKRGIYQFSECKIIISVPPIISNNKRRLNKSIIVCNLSKVYKEAKGVYENKPNISQGIFKFQCRAYINNLARSKFSWKIDSTPNLYITKHVIL